MMRGASSAPPKPRPKPAKPQPVKQAPRKDSAVVASGPRRFSFSRWLELHQEMAVESLSRLLGQFLSSLMTWAVIGIALALPLCLTLVITNLQQFGAGIDQSARITLYLEPTVDETDVRETILTLEERADVADAVYISAEQGLSEFQAATGFDDVLQGLDENPLPAVIQVTPASVDTQTVQALVSQLGDLSIVESASLDLEWVQRLNAILSLVQRLTLGLAGLLCLGVLLVIGNTIRLSIENRRAEIVVVKLVGGTNAYVARPFLYTGLWYGVGGGLIAVAVVSAGMFFLQEPVSQIAGLYSGNYALGGWDISVILMVLAGSGMLGWIGAWISVLRHLRAIEPR